MSSSVADVYAKYGKFHNVSDINKYANRFQSYRDFQHYTTLITGKDSPVINDFTKSTALRQSLYDQNMHAFGVFNVKGTDYTYGFKDNDYDNIYKFDTQGNITKYDMNALDLNIDTANMLKWQASARKYGLVDYNTLLKEFQTVYEADPDWNNYQKELQEALNQQNDEGQQQAAYEKGWAEHISRLRATGVDTSEEEYYKQISDIYKQGPINIPISNPLSDITQGNGGGYALGGGTSSTNVDPLMSVNPMSQEQQKPVVEMKDFNLLPIKSTWITNMPGKKDYLYPKGSV